MREGTEVTYKGHVLIALAIPERGTYTSMLIAHDPDESDERVAHSARFPALFRRRALRCSMEWLKSIADHFRSPIGRRSTLLDMTSPACSRRTNRSSVH